MTLLSDLIQYQLAWNEKCRHSFVFSDGILYHHLLEFINYTGRFDSLRILTISIIALIFEETSKLLITACDFVVINYATLVPG